MPRCFRFGRPEHPSSSEAGAARCATLQSVCVARSADARNSVEVERGADRIAEFGLLMIEEPADLFA